MAVVGRKYPIFFRDAFDAAQEGIMQVELADLCLGPPPAPADYGVEGPQ